MASNKKWFKRAIRTLSSGETQLWNLIKNKLTSEQVSYFEDQFLRSPEEVEVSNSEVVTEVKVESESQDVEPEAEKVTPKAKTKERQSAAPKGKGKKKTTAKKTKTISKEK